MSTNTITNNNQAWIWKIYLICLCLAASRKLIIFFQPYTQINNYYVILRAFDPLFNFAYFCGAIQVFFNLFQCIPLFFFIYQRPAKRIHLWRVLFILKIVFDIIGNSFVLNEYKAISYEGSWLYLLMVFFFSTAFYLPSGLVWFLYAFKDEYLFAFQEKSGKKD